MINLFILYIHLPGSQGRSWKSVYNPAILQKPLRIAQSYSKSPLSNRLDFSEICHRICMTTEVNLLSLHIIPLTHQMQILRKGCVFLSGQSKPSSIWGITVFSSDSSNPLSDKNSRIIGRTPASKSSLLSPVTMK